MMTPRELLHQLTLLLSTNSSPSSDWRTPDVTRITTEPLLEMSLPASAKFGKTLFPNDYPEHLIHIHNKQSPFSLSLKSNWVLCTVDYCWEKVYNKWKSRTIFFILIFSWLFFIIS
jgi:hypothetical protein